MEDNNKANIVFNISGGNNQILPNAKELAQVVMDMVNDTDVKVDQDIMVKQEFIEVLQPLAPQVTTGIGNIRKYINEAWYKWK